MGGYCSVEALVEFFDFAAGLVQRVPKKPNIVKADLLNTTAMPPRKRKFEVERIGFGYVKDIYLYLFYVFVLDRLNIGQILRLQRLSPFPLRMTVVGRTS